MACASFVTFGPGPGAKPSGPTPQYPPGASVTITGHDFSTKAVTPVSVHWGGDTGPELAQAPIGADGTWTLTFQIPADAATGVVHRIGITARDADGQMAESLPLETQVRVVVPGTPEEPQVRSAQPTVREHSAPRSARPVKSTAPREQAVARRVTVPVAAPVAAPAPRRVAVFMKRRSVPAPSVPRPLARKRELPAPVAAHVPVPELPALFVHKGDDPMPYLATLALLLVLGGVGGAGYLARRRRPLDPAPRSDTAPDIEAELQRMIAAEQAKAEERPFEPVS
jgi:hypothetical protein